MNRKLMLSVLIVTFLWLPFQAEAVYIVDTGQPLSSTGGWSLDSSAWLSSKFTATEFYTVTDIEGYLNSYVNGGTLDIAIYGDGGEIPDTNNQIFHSTVSVPSTTSPDWYGLSGLSWDLAAGTYWLAFEVRTPNTFDGSMPPTSPNPLLDEAFSSGGDYNYQASDYLDLGIKIQGNPVPEPTTMLLLGTGLFGLVGLRRKKLRN